MARQLSFDRSRFVSNVAANAPNEAVRGALYELLDFGERHADDIRDGQAKLGSIHYGVSVGNKTVNLVTFNVSGYVSISFGNFSYIVPPRTLTGLSQRIKNLPEFENVKNYDERPGFFIEETIVDPKFMQSFQEAIIDFQIEILQ